MLANFGRFGTEPDWLFLLGLSTGAKLLDARLSLYLPHKHEAGISVLIFLSTRKQMKAFCLTITFHTIKSNLVHFFPRLLLQPGPFVALACN